MKIKADERYLGYNQYGLTGKEAKALCHKLPDNGKEKLIQNNDGCHYWIGRVWFNSDHKFRPVRYVFYATLTNWRLVNGIAILSLDFPTE